MAPWLQIFEDLASVCRPLTLEAPAAFSLVYVVMCGHHLYQSQLSPLRVKPDHQFLDFCIRLTGDARPVDFDYLIVGHPTERCPILTGLVKSPSLTAL